MKKFLDILTWFILIALCGGSVVWHFIDTEKETQLSIFLGRMTFIFGGIGIALLVFHLITLLLFPTRK